jgi:uncharacterized repeat protein (TIGR02543 family)
MYVLNGTPVFPTGALSTGYKDLVVKKGSSTITNSSSQTISADTTFSTSATIITYTIGYTLNGGSVSTANPTSYTVTTNTFTLNNPTKSGYTFNGWTGSNGNTAQTSVSITKGTTVKVVPTVTGGSGSYTYKYTILNVETGKWGVLKDFSSSTSYSGAMSSVGTRQFVVSVKDSTGKTVATNRITVKVTEGATTALSVKFTANGGTGNIVGFVGDSVALKAIATGGSGSYTYNFQLANIALTSYVTLGTSSDNTYTWKSISAGKRYLVVTVTDSKGNTVTDKKEIMIL